MNPPDMSAAWGATHDRYLEAHLDRLRLLARRRVDWLRSVRWRTDPLDADDDERRVDRVLADGTPAADGADGGSVAPRPRQGGDRNLDEQIVAHDRLIGALEAELVTMGGPPADAVLQRAVGLSTVERDAVVVALAPELDHTFRGLYAYLHDDPAMRSATPGLVADLTGRALHEVWDLADPAAPSRAMRVFDDADGAAGAARPLRLDARIVAFLRGVNRVDERLRSVVTELPELPLAPVHRRLADQLARWLSDPDRAAGHRVVSLVGAPGQGREAVAAGLARALGLAPLRVHPEQLVSAAETAMRRLLDRETLLLPAALYVDEPTDAGDAAAVTALWQALDDLGGLLLVGGRTRAATRHPTLVVDVPPLHPTERAQLWHRVLGDTAVGDADLQSLVEQFPLGPGQIVRAAEEARARAEVRQGVARAEPDHRDVWAACRTAVGGELSKLSTRLTPAFSWVDLVLPDREKRVLRDIAAQVAARPRVYGDWGFGRRLTRGRGITALFAGPSGTGKTMAAEVVAGHLGLDLHRIDLSSVISKYIGETEKNLRRVFDAADEGGAVLFFDEADALFGKRTEVSDSHDRYANVEINYLLQRMEDYTGLAVLATNRKTDLDPAFLRRIRFVVTFPYPDTNLRRRIWQGVWPEETPVDELDWDALARLEVAGGNIRTIAVNAAFLAATAGEAVGMVHVLCAARLEYDKLDRRPSRSEFGEHYEEVHP